MNTKKQFSLENVAKQLGEINKKFYGVNPFEAVQDPDEADCHADPENGCMHCISVGNYKVE